MFEFDVVTLSRLQFALTAMYHFLFVPLTLGLALLLAIMESVYVMTGRTVWREATQFWGTLFGINFAMGVATGVTMEFQFGTNWAYYSHYVGDIFGAPLAIEGLMAFFLEATFVGLFFFGWKRLSKVQHLVVTWLVALGANFSALWILVANAWMQNPVGAAFNPQTMRMELTSFSEVLFNPVAQSKFVHTVSAGYVTGAMFVMSIAAYFILNRRHVDIARRSLTVAASFGLASALSVVVLGDESGYTAGENQKMKIAAIEAMWETEPPPASFTVFGFPDLKSETTKDEIRIPYLLGLIATRSLDKPVEGVKALVERSETRIRNGMAGYQWLAKEGGHPNAAVPPELEASMRDVGHSLLVKRIRPDIENATDAQIHEAAMSTIPDVPVLFWSFRIMVALGFYFIALFAVAFYLSSKRRCGKPWFLRMVMYSLPLPWVAAELGWIVAEYGRQPWIIDGDDADVPRRLQHPRVECRGEPRGLRAVLQRARHHRCRADRQICPHRPTGGGRASSHRRARASRAGAGAEPIGKAKAMFDYMTLRLIWWALLGVLLAGFAVLDGFDIGVAMLHPFVARNDAQRRVTLNAIGPVWEGNQVWFILGGGAVFAAWPPLYAVSFSGFYLAMLLVLIGFILRPVAIVFRGKREARGWRETWDWLFFVSGFVPALIFGVAFGNLLQGVPFHFDQTLRATYEGGLLGLLNPFGLLCGLVSVTMLAMQGAAWLSVKSEGDVAVRARRYGALAAILLVLLISAAGLWTMLGVEGYRIVGVIDHAGPSNPLSKTVTREAGAWLDNYRAYPWMIAAPAAGLCGRACRRPRLRLVGEKTRASREQPVGCRRRGDGGLQHVPLPAAVIDSPEPKPDGLGRVVEQRDALAHAHRGDRLSADRPCLHQLGLLRAARRSDRGGDPSRRRLLLLSGRKRAMWYFSWILGLGLACAFAILNAMWLELDDDDRQK